MKTFLTYDNLVDKNKKNHNIVMKVVWDWLFLDEFLKNLNPKNSLEIGVNKGLTFSLIHKYSKHSLGIELSKEYKYPTNWNIIFKDSNKLDNNELGENLFFDFIHIDGGHSYKQVINDLKKCELYINDNTIICMDDYSHEIGVLDAVNYFLKKNKNIFLKCYGISQVFLVTKKSEKIFNEVILKFEEKTVELLKLKTCLHIDIWPHYNDTIVLKKLTNNLKFMYLKDKLQNYFKLV